MFFKITYKSHLSINLTPRHTKQKTATYTQKKIVPFSSSHLFVSLLIPDQLLFLREWRCAKQMGKETAKGV